MQRLTKRVGDIVTYIGRYTNAPGIECAASMRVAARRECMDRLEQYENTGLSPEQIMELKQRDALRD